jgi:amino acid transporter
MSQDANETSPTRSKLGLWDAIAIIVGIVVGTAIFKTPKIIFSCVDGPWQGMGAWALGGGLALVGAFCYAELATTYPRVGGDYVYLTKAFGRPVGFLFGWAQLTVILTASIGAMAYAFADYAVGFWGLDNDVGVWLAVAAVVALAIINLLGVMAGKSVQNLLSVVKVVGLLGIVVIGFGWGGDASQEVDNPTWPAGFGLAMVLVLYAYGGWNDAAFVAAEVRDVHRNIPRALFLGIAGITVIYLLVNGAYLWALGFEGVRASETPAADTLRVYSGESGAKAMSVLVMISALGAINGLIFTGSRIYAGMGAEHRIFALLGRWHPTFAAPVWALTIQALIACAMILLVGTPQGWEMIDAGLSRLDMPLPDWYKNASGFETLVTSTAPVFWMFFLLTGVSVFVLRDKDPDRERPFRMPFYPWTPLIFILTSIFMLQASVSYAEALSLIGFVPLVIGLPVYFVSQWMRPKGIDSASAAKVE